MKQLIFILGCAVIVGCSTTSQRTVFNTIGALELTASSAVDGYDTALIKGLADTKNAAQIESGFNDFQHAAALAANLTQNGTNALAPVALTSELASLTTLIASSTLISTNK